MKRLLKFVVEWKTWVGLMFTGTVALYLVLCLILGQETVAVAMLWTLLALSVVGTLVQALCFTDLLIRRMRYTWRLLLFCLLFFPMLAAVAWAFHWFPMEGGSWIAFTGIFLAVLAVMTVGFEIYYRVTGRKYDGLLGQYRKEKEKRGE